MAISPQYSQPWKIIPTYKGDSLEDTEAIYITWVDKLECFIDAENPDWEIIAAPWSIALGNHIVDLHNKRVKEYEASRQAGMAGEVEKIYSSLSAVVEETAATEAVIYAFGGWYPADSNRWDDQGNYFEDPR
jgi:hypothetical protein